jgi:hypothetical protein
MGNIANHILGNTTQEEQKRVINWINVHKYRPRFGFYLVCIAVCVFFIIKIPMILPYVLLNLQTTLNCVLVGWVAALVLTPFLWPEKPGDVFSEDFKKDISPRIWERDNGS